MTHAIPMPGEQPTPPPGPDGVPTATEYVTQLQGERPPTIEERVQTNVDLERVQLARQQEADGQPSEDAIGMAGHLRRLLDTAPSYQFPTVPVEGVPSAFRVDIGGRQLLVHVMEVGQ